MRQPLPDLQRGVDTRGRGRRRKALGIAEQQFGRADQHQRRRKPLQVGEQRRRQR
ncbi:MAG TPA: hypothetical protein VJT49_05585 [Amycolatopsis sp.]|nr:hypothetical protein [Amycolatopsis sp.]HKS44578.1 hypothetical protein [Amycolatopsis sp.]